MEDERGGEPREAPRGERGRVLADRGTRLGLIGPGDEGDRAPGPGAGHRQTAVDRNCQAAELACRAGGPGLPLRRPTAGVTVPGRGDLGAASAVDADDAQLLPLAAATASDPDSDRAGCRPGAALLRLGRFAAGLRGRRGLARAVRAAAGYEDAGGEEGQRQDPGQERHQEPTKLPARAKTASIIGSVSLPVNVFCWLGW